MMRSELEGKQFHYQAKHVLEESKIQAKRSFGVREAREIGLARTVTLRTVRSGQIFVEY